MLPLSSPMIHAAKRFTSLALTDWLCASSASEPTVRDTRLRCSYRLRSATISAAPLKAALLIHQDSNLDPYINSVGRSPFTP